MLFPIKGADLKSKIEALVLEVKAELAEVKEENYYKKGSLSSGLERFSRILRNIDMEKEYLLDLQDLESLGF